MQQQRDLTFKKMSCLSIYICVHCYCYPLQNIAISSFKREIKFIITQKEKTQTSSITATLNKGKKRFTLITKHVTKVLLTSF